MANKISKLPLNEMKVTDDYLREVEQIGKERHRNELLVLVCAVLCSMLSFGFLCYIANKMFILGMMYMGISVYFGMIKDCVWQKILFIIDRNSFNKFDKLTLPYTKYLDKHYSDDSVEDMNCIFSYALGCGVYIPTSLKNYYTRDRKTMEEPISTKKCTIDEGYDALCRLVGGYSSATTKVPTFEETQTKPSYDYGKEKNRIDEMLQAVDYHYNMATTQKHMKH